VTAIESQIGFYRHDPLYRFTEGEARELADEVLRLRAVIEDMLKRHDVGIVSYEELRKVANGWLEARL
jgi:hypothetical protein